MEIPYLLIKDGQVVLGKKGGTDIECYCVVEGNKVMTDLFIVKTPKGQVVCYNTLSDYIVTSINVTGNIIPLEYVGDLEKRPTESYCVFASQDRKVFIGCNVKQKEEQTNVQLCGVKYFKYLSYDGFCLENIYQSDYKVVNEYLVVVHNKIGYLFKDLECIDKWEKVPFNFVEFLAMALRKGFENNKVEEYIELVNKLVGLSKLRDKLGRYSIGNILDNKTNVTMEQLKEMLNNPELMQEVIGGTSKVYKQIKLALAQVDSVPYLITYSEHLKKVDEITVEIRPKSVSLLLSGKVIIEFRDKVYEPYYSYLRRLELPELNIHKFLYKFGYENSLSTTLSKKQIQLWAGLLKHLNKDKQIIYQNE